MTDQADSKPDSDRPVELIAEVSADDRAAARRAVSDGVRAAQDQWIEAHWIAEALAAELIQVAEISHHRERIAAHLRQLAKIIEAKPDLH